MSKEEKNLKLGMGISTGASAQAGAGTGTGTDVGSETESLTESLKNQFSLLKTDAELEKMFTNSLNESQTELELNMQAQGIYQQMPNNNFALNFTPTHDELTKSKINLLLSRLENRLELLNKNVSIFLKINTETTLFKKNVIKFFLFLKLKQKNQQKKKKNLNIQYNSHLNIDKKLKIEKSSIERLKHSVKDITNVKNKITSNIID